MSSSKELVVSQNRHETKLGILEDGQLVEVYFQRANEYSLAGSVHKGRVTRVLPGMQSAFVDLGLERDCFLYVSDFFEDHGEEIDRVEDRGPKGRGRERGDRDRDKDRGRGRDGRRDSRRDGGRGDRSAAPAEEEPTAPAQDAALPAAVPQPEDSSAGGRDRGRRSRRRRRGRGFPESKYAETDGAETADANGQDASGDTPGGVTEAAAEDTAETPETGEIVVLPGETLAKYRRGRSRRKGSARDAEEATEPAPASAPEAVEAVEAAAEDEALDEADYEAAAEDAAESILDRVAEMEASADARAGELVEAEEEIVPVDEDEDDDEDDDVEFVDVDLVVDLEGSVETEDVNGDDDDEDDDVEIFSSADLEAVQEEESDGGDESNGDETADASSDDEGRIGIAMEVDSGGARVLSEEEAAEVQSEGEGEEGVEPARKPVSLTAALRTQGGKLGHRATRRSRRRGRGGDRQDRDQGGDTADARVESDPIIAEPIIAEPATAEPVRERERDRDRDRDRDRREREPRPERESTPLPSISDLLKEGQEIIVQIAKEPLGQKGARITSHIALPGRYVVYMPTVEHLGVSRKISTEDERLRLKKILIRQREGLQGGYIMRTAGEGRTEEEIGADMKYLADLWTEIKTKADRRRAPALLHHDVEIVERILRDHLTGGFKAIWVDQEDIYEQVLHTVERFSPHMLNRVKLYTRPEPIFDAFGITGELEKALRPKVWLKSGGYIVINQTEALVAIDINTGKYVGKSNRLEDTIVKTNIEAVKEIVRQIRLRDLGGIIVVDFIDMDERKNRQKVMQALEETMRLDKAPYKILQFNDFGLVAITRKRVKQSLERTLCSPCPYCEGSGYVKSEQTIIEEILNQAKKYARVVDGAECVLRVGPEVAKKFKAVETNYLEELEEILGRPVMVIADVELHQEKFDLT